MLRIDRMQMHLPAGFEHRASSIARLVGESMAAYQPSESRHVDRLSLSPVQVSPNATDQQIALNIAERIINMLGRGA